jgi:transposase-like protein
MRLKILPVLAFAFRRRKCPVGSSQRMDETYVLVSDVHRAVRSQDGSAT